MYSNSNSVLYACVLIFTCACNSTPPANPELVNKIENEAHVFAQTYTQQLQPKVDSLEQIVQALAQKHHAQFNAASPPSTDATVGARPPAENRDETTEMVSGIVMRLERIKNAREEAEKRYQQLLEDYKAGKISEAEANAQFEQIRSEFSQYDRAISRTLEVSKSLMEKLPDAPAGSKPTSITPNKPEVQPAEPESPNVLQKQ